MKIPTPTTISTGSTLFAFVFVTAGTSVLAYLLSVQFAINSEIDPRVGIIPFIIVIPLLHIWFFHGIATALTNLYLALTYLNQNKPVTALSVANCPPMLKPMIEQVNLLIGERADLKTMRGQLVTQISEAAAQEERNRLARDLHDSIKQQVFSINISAAAAEAHLDANPQAARAALRDVKQGAQEAMVEMRALLQQLSPAPLEKSGLIQALRDQCEALAYRTGATVTPTFSPTIPPDDRLPPGAQEAIFRIAQEALSNIARHARAQHIWLSLNVAEEQHLMLRIEDDGQGFDVTTNPTGMGLGNIRSRSAAIGASTDLLSTPGNGTTLTITIPLITPVIPSEEDIMYAIYDKQLKPIISLYFQFAGGVSAFIFSLSLVARRLIYRADTLSDDPILMVLLVVMGSSIIASPLFAGRALIKARRQAERMLISAGRGSRIDFKLQRNIQMAYLTICIIGAWFLPMPWIQDGADNWTAVLIGLGLVGVAVWCYRKMGDLYHAEVLQMPADQRVPELNQRLNELRNSWPSIVVALIATFISGVVIERVQFPPQDVDHWMNTSFISVSLLLLSNQVNSILTYRRWKQAFGAQEKS